MSYSFDDVGPLPKECEKLFQQMENSTKEEFLFVGVIYNLVENGFIVCTEKLDAFDNVFFHKPTMRALGDLKVGELYSMEGNVLTSNLRIGFKERMCKCKLTGRPSQTTDGDFLLLHLLALDGSYELGSLCLPTNLMCIWEIGQLLMYRPLLSFHVKNELGWPIKSYWMQKNLKGCYPHYCHLPYPATRLINDYREKLEIKEELMFLELDGMSVIY